MSKKDFIALADAIRYHNSIMEATPFTPGQIYSLASFCNDRNPTFNRDRWFDYIAGKCGPNGGAVKKA